MEADSWRIKEIQVKGLLNTHNISWRLQPKVNILGGPNGTGKSTLLHALAILLHGVFHKNALQEEVQLHCEALFKSMVAEFASGISCSVERTVSSTSEKVDDSTDGKARIKIVEKIALRGRSSTPADIDPSAQMAKHVLYINSADQALSVISKLAESSAKDNRPAKTVLDVMLEQTLNRRNQLFAQRMSIAMQQDNEEEVSKLRKLFGRFETAVKHFMPGYTILDTSRLLFAPETDKDVKIRYFRMSTGEKQLLYTLLSVCNTLGEPTILLLDEADTGMHIDWKKMLLRELLEINPNMQILAATHSPSLIEGWYDNVREISQLYTDDK